jgi:2-keto-4-pentenoate hydratase/2-oxohepta-3-ene-1,7-dioic acid hydratase in catechol pathway
MRLASVRYEDEDVVAVHLDDERLVDVRTLFELNSAPSGAAVFTDMTEIIRAGRALLDKLDAALSVLRAGNKPVRSIPMQDVTWHAPVRNPGKICGVAMNNSASNARKISAPEHPAFFLKPASCLTGHDRPIRIRPYYGSVHPEPELSVIIGSETRDIAASRALDAVFGYSIFNDITGNGMRAEDMFEYWAVYADEDNPDETVRVRQHLSYAGRYKGTDTFGCSGPWLVTKDEIENPDELNVYCKAGGEPVAEDNTRYYNYKVAEIISFISQFHTLNPGDIISCGAAFKPSAMRKSIHHANLQVTGGPVEVSIDGLGTLVNPVILEDRDMGSWRLHSTR